MRNKDFKVDTDNRKKEFSKVLKNVFCRSFVIGILFYLLSGCEKQGFSSQFNSPSVVIEQENMEILHDDLAAKISSSSAEFLQGEGLIGATGGIHIKLTKNGSQQILLPLPQLSASQIPLCYFIRSNPSNVAKEYLLQKRDTENHVVIMELNGKRNQEVWLEWSAVVMIADRTIASNNSEENTFRSSTKCCQADSETIKQLAEKLWVETDNVEDYARNIQSYIRNMQQTNQPQSLDALGILNSQTNYICTANANLAVALLRAKQIPARSLAVIPPISRRLEMHRIVKYKNHHQWQYFDPSSLHMEIPMKPWQTLIMAKTTLKDENAAMKPRRGVMIGSPYAQELELLTTGVTLWGQDFFWTLAKPLAQFQIDDTSIEMAGKAWQNYLENGTLSREQKNASFAQNSREFSDAFQSK